jgi:hypothetical protein
MVTKIVEASSPGNGGKKPQLVPLKSQETSRVEEGKNKKVIMANNIRIEEDLLGMREVPV